MLRTNERDSIEVDIERFLRDVVVALHAHPRTADVLEETVTECYRHRLPRLQLETAISSHVGDCIEVAFLVDFTFEEFIEKAEDVERE